MQFTEVACFTPYYSLISTKKTAQNHLQGIMNTMLYEITHLRQTNRSLVKRWFTSLDIDLFIWYYDNTPVKFQLSYDKRCDEHAISWGFHQGYKHYSVDTGEDYPDQYKKTPILNDAYQQQNLATLARDFLAAVRTLTLALLILSMRD